MDNPPLGQDNAHKCTHLFVCRAANRNTEVSVIGPNLLSWARFFEVQSLAEARKCSFLSDHHFNYNILKCYYGVFA